MDLCPLLQSLQDGGLQGFKLLYFIQNLEISWSDRICERIRSECEKVIEKLQSNQKEDQTLQKQIHNVEKLTDKIGSNKVSTEFDGMQTKMLDVDIRKKLGISPFEENKCMNQRRQWWRVW